MVRIVYPYRVSVHVSCMPGVNPQGVSVHNSRRRFKCTDGSSHACMSLPPRGTRAAGECEDLSY